MRYSLIVLLALTLILTTSCKRKEITPAQAAANQNQTAKSTQSKPEAQESKVDTGDDEQVIGAAIKAGNPRYAITDFAIDFLNKNRQEGTNIIISPLSVMTAMAMASDGAAGDTGKEFELFLGGPQGEVNSFYQTVMEDLNGLSDIKVSLANRIFINNIEPKAKFIEDLQLNFAAGAQNLNFSDSKSVDVINEWVNEKTNGLIPKTLDSLNANDRMVLVNTLYFKAKWLSVFDNTYTGDFFLRNNKTSSIKYMTGNKELGYYKDDDIEAVIMPYENERFKIVLILPEGGSFNITKGIMKEIIESSVDKLLNISIPVMELEDTLHMEDYFKANGPALAFDPSTADFSGITDDEKVFISGVLHKTKVIVDEEGTEAAAVTAVIMRMSANIKVPEAITFNKPFAFYIWDAQAEIPLFMGYVEEL